VDWLENSDTPDYVVGWLDRVTRQQEAIEAACQ